jgi:ABC-type bacteriocin/lantibiotic exporter with double-glycine peptidase domain
MNRDIFIFQQIILIFSVASLIYLLFFDWKLLLAIIAVLLVFCISLIAFEYLRKKFNSKCHIKEDQQ